MSLQALLARFREAFPDRGECVLRRDEQLSKVLTRKRVSAGYGVYVISAFRGSRGEPLYIGKAGTIQQDGRPKGQGIRKRLRMKQDGKRRAEYFQEVIRDRNLDGLHIEWLVTFGDARVPPFLAEAELLATFFQEHGTLPALNKTA